MNTGLKLSARSISRIETIKRVAAGVYPVGSVVDALMDKQRVAISGPGAFNFIRASIATIGQQGGTVAIIDRNQHTDSADYINWQGELLADSTVNTRRQQWLDACNRPIFDDYLISEVAGLWLSAQKKTLADLISRQITFGNLTFSSAAYLDYCDKIRKTQKHFLQLGYLPPALQELNAGIFKHQQLEDCKEFISTHLETFIAKGEELQYAYNQSLNDHYRRGRAQLRLAAKDLKSALDDLATAASTYVSADRRARKLALSRLKTSLEHLQQIHEKNSPFVIKWPNRIDKIDSKNWETWLCSYDESLLEWQENHRNLLREEQIGLSAASAKTAKEVWEQLTKDQEELLEQINNSGLFQRPVNAAAATVLRNQKLVEQLLEKLQKLKQLMTVLPDFYHWQHNWLSLPAALRRVVTPLLNNSQTDWIAAFSAWYFEVGLLEYLQIKRFESSIEATTQMISSERTHFVFSKKDEALLKATVDLIIIIGEVNSTDYKGIPQLQLLGEDGDETSKIHYLSRYGVYRPGIAFCQNWGSLQWAKWELNDYPKSLGDARKLIVDFFGVAEAEAAQFEPEARWTIIIQQEKNGALSVLNRQYLSKQNIHKAMVFSTNIANNSDVALGRILSMLWAEARHCAFIINHDQQELTSALLSDGFSTAFALAASIRGVEAINDKDRKAWDAIAAEVRKRLKVAETHPNPLAEELLPQFQQQYPTAELQQNYQWRDLQLPIVINNPDGKRIVILPDDLINGIDTIGVEVDRRRELQSAGFICQSILTDDILVDKVANV